MSARTGLEIVGVDHPRKAVEAADMVVSSGPILMNPRPTIEKGWLKPGREGAGERIMVMNLGLALDDMAVAPEILRVAEERGLGTHLPL